MSEEAVPLVTYSQQPFDTAIDRFVAVLNVLGCLEVIEQRLAKDGRSVSFLCRETDRRHWLQLLPHYLRGVVGWKQITAQEISLSKDGQGLTYAWRIGMRSENIIGALEQAGSLFLKAKATVNGETASAKMPAPLNFTPVATPRQIREVKKPRFTVVEEYMAGNVEYVDMIPYSPKRRSDGKPKVEEYKSGGNKGRRSL